MIKLLSYRSVISRILKGSNLTSKFGFCKESVAREFITNRTIMGTGLPLADVLLELNKFADLKLAESWDNVGLLVEPSTPTKIINILLTNDLTEEVMDEALTVKANLIISYHPPIFAPLKKITNATWKERIIAKCLENRIAIFSPHTSWDAALGGVTDWLIQAFSGEFDDRAYRCLVPSDSAVDKRIYIDVIGPPHVLQPLVLSQKEKFPFSASQLSDGRAMFKLYCEKKDIQRFLDLDEIDVIVNTAERKQDLYRGMGRVIYVKNLTLSSCVERLKRHLGLNHVRLAVGMGKTKESTVKTIAFVPGSGGSLLKGVTSDLYVTGEMFHHDILEANHNGASVILTNHSDSERGFLHCMRDNLKKIFSNEVDVLVSVKDKDPIETV